MAVGFSPRVLIEPRCVLIWTLKIIVSMYVPGGPKKNVPTLRLYC